MAPKSSKTKTPQVAADRDQAPAGDMEDNIVDAGNEQDEEQSEQVEQTEQLEPSASPAPIVEEALAFREGEKVTPAAVLKKVAERRKSRNAAPAAPVSGPREVVRNGGKRVIRYN